MCRDKVKIYCGAIKASVLGAAESGVTAATQLANGPESKKINELIGIDFPKQVKSEEVLKLLESSETVRSCHDIMTKCTAMHTYMMELDKISKQWLGEFPLASEIHKELEQTSAAVRGALEVKALTDLGAVLSDWTAVQAIFRGLQPGETRKSLCAKVAKGIAKRKWFAFSPDVHRELCQMAGLPIAGTQVS